VGEVHGVDMTPAMVEVARREAAAEGIGNAVFSVGDATALDFADASFDGAVVLADHVTSADADEAAWHQEIERLRDPSHWACLTPARLRALGEAAGLVLEREDETPISIDYEEWIGRGSGGPGSAGLISRALADRVPAPDGFRVVDGSDGRRLELRYWISVWRRP